MKKIFLFAILSVFLASCHFHNDDINQFVNSFSYKTLSQEDFYQLLYFKDTNNVVIVDLRDPRAFAIGHLPGAVNIPGKNLLDKKHKKLLGSEKIKVFYSDDPSYTRMITAVAVRSGYPNCYALLGNYKSLRDNFVKKFAIRSAFYDDELPDFDYKEKFAELSSGKGVASEQKPSAPVSITVPVKKKEVGGGCE